MIDLNQFSIAVGPRGTAMDVGMQKERDCEMNNTQNCSTNQPFTITNLYKYNELTIKQQQHVSQIIIITIYLTI